MQHSLNKEFSNSLKIQNSLAMQNSLSVLQMPIEELSLWIQSQIEENPMLEWDETSPKERISPPRKQKNFSCGFVDDNLAYEPSLFEYVMTQVRQTITEPLALEKMEWIVGNLEETGFFTTSFESAPNNWNLEELSSLLKELQQLSLPGIGARNLQESLLLQLKAKGEESSLGYKIIEHDLENLIQGRLLILQKKYQVDEKSLYEAIHHKISSLDPYPGLRFGKNISPFVTPDLFLLEENSLWKVVINEEKLPAYTIKPFPAQFGQFNAEDKLFFRKYMGQAKWAHYAIEKRRETLQKIAEHLIQAQTHYLKGDSDSLVPLTVQEIAEKTSLHESTVARAVCNKYLSCSLGVIPLKSLFSKCLNKESEHISSDQAQKLLQKLIAEEDKKKPLSDKALLEKMRTVGVPCARRTVTKYRQILHIPARRFRKKHQDI